MKIKSMLFVLAVVSITSLGHSRCLLERGDLFDRFHFRHATKYYDPETGLYYYGERYYSPELGRWINRDPIEEQDGPGLYLFLKNDAINKWDFLGLWSATEESKGKSRRKYQADCGDTIEDLAKMVKLSHSYQQYSLWLKSEDGGALPKTSQEKISRSDRVFSIPNTGYMDASTYSWGFLAAFLKGQSSQMKTRWEEEGLKVVYNKGSAVTVSSIASHLGSNDIYKFAYFGHGAAGQLTAINDTRTLKPEEEFGMRGIFAAGKYTRYGIAEMSLYACASGAEINRWKQNVSVLGVLLVLKGDENFQVWDVFQNESFIITNGSSK